MIDAAAIEDDIGARPTIFLDARPAAAYEQGHIPGAANVDLFDYFVDTSSEGIDRLNQELGEIFGVAGIGGDERVVCYEDELGMRAARALWFLEYAGHADARILRGGFRAWRAGGGPVCSERCVPRRRTFRVEPRPAVLATAEYIASPPSTHHSAVLDVRSLAEHRGETTSSHGACCPRAGRIPASTWLEWSALLTPDRGDLRPPAEIRRLLAERGIRPEHEVITYCHRGARAAAAYLALKEAGFARVRNYIGSWHEWAELSRLPIESG